MRARGVETFRRAEDEFRETVGRVRCVLCLCSTGARDWEVEIFGVGSALVRGAEVGTGGVDGEVESRGW